MREIWFFGDVEFQEEKEILSEVGEYLVRLGHKEPGSFVVSFVQQGKKLREINHILIHNHNGIFSCKKPPIKVSHPESFPLLVKQLISECKVELQKPAPQANCKFYQFRPYLGDDDEEEPSFS